MASETAIRGAFSYKESVPQLIRYADDLVILHPTEAGVQKAKQLLDTWLSTIGLELKPSKTRITHTLWEYQGHLGFDLSSLDHPTISGGQNPHGEEPARQTPWLQNDHHSQQRGSETPRS